MQRSKFSLLLPSIMAVRQLVFAAVVSLCLAASTSEKSDELRQLSAISESNIILLNATGYQHYVVDYPRPYTLVVLFTADAEKYKCKTCAEISEMMKTVVYSYREARAEYPFSSPTGQRSRAVFFALLEYSQENQELYMQHGFQSVPNLLVTHPKSVFYDGSKFHFPKDDMWEFSLSSEVPVHKLLDFINSRTSRSVELKFTALQILTGLAKWCVIITVLTTVFFKLRSVITSPYVLFLLGLVVYFLCVSGTIYIILNGVPMTGGNKKTGDFELIHRGQRSQYGAEGYFIGFLICLGALCLIFINNLSKVENTLTIRVASYLALGFLLFTLYELDVIYKFKASWYFRDFFFPPKYYTKGPLINDQGSSF